MSSRPARTVHKRCERRRLCAGSQGGAALSAAATLQSRLVARGGARSATGVPLEVLWSFLVPVKWGALGSAAALVLIQGKQAQQSRASVTTVAAFVELCGAEFESGESRRRRQVKRGLQAHLHELPRRSAAASQGLGFRCSQCRRRECQAQLE